jgi:hypothetical protein
MSNREIPDQAPFAKLPVLPAGWHYEANSSDPDILYVVWPNNGAMSVHLKRRTFAGGWCIPNMPARTEAPRGGRGWKEQLIADAVTHFQGIFKEPGAPCPR